VLGVNRSITKNELAKVYRRLAKQHHPDRARGTLAKEKAEEKFRQIATAYETLKDEDTRSDYNEFLDNPEHRYYHYYRYYRRRVSVQVDVRLVVLVTILLISIIQYISAYHKFNEAIDYLSKQHKYRSSALDIAQQKGLLHLDEKGKVKKKRKGDIDDTDTIIRRIIEENMDIRGGYSRPNIFHTLFFRILCLPVSLYKYSSDHIIWFWKYTIRKEEYDDQAKLDIIRRRLNFSKDQWTSQTNEELEDFLARRLWLKEEFDAWKKEREEMEKEKLANSGRYKRYRRYMRNTGPGQISFVDD